MNEDRVKSLFGSRRFNSARFERERERERELSSVPGQGDIILQPTKPKSRLKVVFLVLGAILLLVGSVVAGVLIFGNKKEEHVDNYLLELIDEYRDDVYGAQDLMRLYTTWGKWYNGFFSDDNLTGINKKFSRVSEFYEKIKNIKPEEIRDDRVRDIFVALRDNLRDNHHVYENALYTYNKCYDYINLGGDYNNSDHIADDEVESLLAVFYNACIKRVGNINTCGELWPNTLPDEFITEIFSKHLTDTYLDVNYNDAMGRINALIVDFGEGYDE